MELVSLKTTKDKIRVGLFILFASPIVGMGLYTLFQVGQEELAVGAPSTEVSFYKHLIPITDSTYDLGTTTKAWRTAYIDELCLTADSCETAWPAGGVGGGGVSNWSFNGTTLTPTTTTAGLDINGTSTFATTTFDYVGIGTASPSSPLEIHSYGTNNYLKLQNSTSDRLWIGREGTLAFLSVLEAEPFHIRTNNTSRLTVGGTGSIGIGTTTPVTLLDVNGDIRGANITATGTASSANAVISNNFTFNGVTADTWPEFCSSITGTSDLCDDDDNTTYTAGDGLTLTADDLDCDTASASVFGCLASADFTTFMGKVGSTSIDTSSEIAALVTDETGTAGSLVFSTNPLLAGFRSNASSTIGGGTGATGLTIDGTATTTGNIVMNSAASTLPILSIYENGTQMASLGDSNLGGNIGNLYLYSAGTDKVRLNAGGTSYIGGSSGFLIDSSGGFVAPNGTTTNATSTTLFSTDATFTRTHSTTSPSFLLASTTPDASGNKFSSATTTHTLKNAPEAMTLIGWSCVASSTGSVSVRFGDGTNWTNSASCSTTRATTYASSNNTFTQWEDFKVQIGSSASSPSWVTITTIIRN